LEFLAQSASDVVPIEEWTGELPFSTSLTPLLGEGVAKASLKRRSVLGDRPETERSNYEQGELRLASEGGPNPSGLQSGGMTCG